MEGRSLRGGGDIYIALASEVLAKGHALENPGRGKERRVVSKGGGRFCGKRKSARIGG